MSNSFASTASPSIFSMLSSDIGNGISGVSAVSELSEASIGVNTTRANNPRRTNNVGRPLGMSWGKWRGEKRKPIVLGESQFSDLPKRLTPEELYKKMKDPNANTERLESVNIDSYPVKTNGFVKNMRDNFYKQKNLGLPTNAYPNANVNFDKLFPSESNTIQKRPALPPRKPFGTLPPAYMNLPEGSEAPPKKIGRRRTRVMRTTKNKKSKTRKYRR